MYKRQILNINEIVSFSQQGDDVRIEMNCFGEQHFVKKTCVKDFILSLKKEIKEPSSFYEIVESDNNLHIRTDAILSLSKQQHTNNNLNTRLVLAGKHHHVINNIDAAQFYEKYVAQ